MKEELADSISAACAKLGYEVARELIIASLVPAKPEFGDIASTIAFQLAKEYKKNPNEIAQAIAKAIKADRKFVEKADVVGGYVNFYLGNTYYVNSVKEIMAAKENFGKITREAPGKIAIEYPSVNPNKPWHVGHLRNALLGKSISNILEFAGYNIERMNYINDLGLQVAQSVWGYLTLPELDEKKFDHLLGKQYVEVSKQQEKMEPEVRRMLKKLEDRDPSVSKRAREICEKCVQAQLETAFNFGIYGDVLIWESDILESKLFDKVTEKLKKSDVFEKKEEGDHAGCYVLKLDPNEFPSVKSDDKVIIRSDGTATYTAKDVAFTMWKFGLIDHRFKYKRFLKQPNGKPLDTTAAEGKEREFGKVDTVINVIGSEQSYLQDVIRFMLRRMGYAQAERYIHVAYEHVILPEEKLSGRAGTWVGHTADELFTEAVKRALVEIEKRVEKSGPKGKMKEKEKEKIAKMIANAAIKFSFLRVSPSKQVVFDIERAVSFEGGTGPYTQYACVRAKRILEKLEDVTPQITLDYKMSDPEKQLVKKLIEFPVLIEKASNDFQCYYLAEYVLEVADLFSKFYETTPVVKAEDKEKRARMAVVFSTITVIQNTLKLLGIEVPDRM